VPASATDILRAAGVAYETVEMPTLGTLLRVARADACAALSSLGAECYDQLVDLFGTDTGSEIEITYHVRALERMADVYVRCAVPYDGELRSVWQVYPAALYPEREAAELLGFSLTGHPNPKRLLTTDGTEPLLRKSVLVRDAEEVRYS
jgi:NADH:ubiquinone oxidoreductase subunit C